MSEPIDPLAAIGPLERGIRAKLERIAMLELEVSRLQRLVAVYSDALERIDGGDNPINDPRTLQEIAFRAITFKS